jgi:hypothetical protein
VWVLWVEGHVEIYAASARSLVSVESRVHRFAPRVYEQLWLFAIATEQALDQAKTVEHAA